MTDIIYNYPKSSCSCLNENNTKSESNTFRITEYGRTFEYDNQTILNPDIVLKNTAKDFTLTSNNTFTSLDQRLIKSLPYMRMELDKPPMDTDIKLEDIYNKDLQNYGKKYTSYKDITGGQITYYVSNTCDDPYYQTIFNKNVETEYQDPMNSMRIPEIIRVPINSINPLTSTINSDSGFCLPWLKDTMSNREDNMSYAYSSINKINRN